MKARIVALIVAVFALFGIAAVPAFAQGTPGPTTNQTGSISVPSTLTLTTNLPATFTLSAATDNLATAVGGGSLTVVTNDANGYEITLNGPANNFVGQADSSNSIPVNDVRAGTSSGGGYAALVYPPSQWVQTGNATSGTGDVYSFAGFFIPTMPNVAPDTYSGQIQWVLWGL